MDTWATSSLTPMINMKYGEKENYEDILKPMTLRSNAHDNIRVWDFYTIVKSFYHFKQLPWKDVMISGFVMAGKSEKMSKSKSNASSDPITLVDNYSADVVRYYGGTGKLGLDTVFDQNMFDRGRKLVNKIWNVSKFIEMHLSDYEDKEFESFEYIDKWIIAKYQEMEKGFIKYLEDYEVGLALNHLEKFFWNFCDNYIEIVKHRLYRPEEFGSIPRYSGQKTIYTLLYKLLQDFSIYFPFITEEIFQELYHTNKSIHLTKIEPLNFKFEDEIINGNLIIDIIGQGRGAKTNSNVSLKTPIKNLGIKLNDGLKKAIEASIKDFKATLFIQNLELVESDDKFEITNIELELEEHE
jgi:valyl-tRNA synthetase